MRDRRHPIIAIGLGLSLFFGSVALAGSISRAPSPTRAATPRFHVRGHVRHLYPGARLRFRVRVRNPLDVAIVVRRISARVVSPTPSCPSTSVRVRPWRGAVRIPAHSFRRIRMRARLVRRAPEDCQGVRFRLVFRGQAVKR
jgi:hypothetical protein